MATITVRVSDDEKKFLDHMAAFEGKSLSDLLKTKTLESIEDAYDASIGDLAYEEYLKDKKSNPFSKLMEEYGLTE
ncbi:MULTISPECIES: type II toxin-antitoxin system RelB family antitoxin [unclassified Enterococcus]|uniref:type II toxin-antitoxin system RelB family antitoxin n=1 Tax=unclassified Enterococcus TaxID=2608891 RepID=UPI003F2524B8